MSELAENKTFPSGRHRNKTYLNVYESDKDFCHLVLKGEKSKFIPDDFYDFLVSKIESFSLRHWVEERNGVHFVKAFNAEMNSHFRDIIGRPDIHLEEIHPPGNTIVSNGFLGVFYHFFVQKHVSNITNTDGFCKYLDAYKGIFPFPVSDRVVIRHDIEILNSIDNDLFTEMQIFLNRHFDDGVGIRCVARKFFANIANFRQKNVPEKAILYAVKDLRLRGLSPGNDREENYNEKFCFNQERAEYLKTYPRVNRSGVSRYQRMYEMIVSVTELYGKPCNVSRDKYESNYLQKLPEVNLYELYSLLNVQFLRNDRREYVYRFKKYLFFFVNALRNDSNPVFFIDDGLFECLLCYSTYKKSRNDVERLKFELSMLTLAYRRKQNFDEARGSYRVEDGSLRDVKNYFDNYPGIVNAKVKPETLADCLETQVFVSTDRVAMDVCYRNARRNTAKDFYELILHGALSSNDYERLVIYNAFTGEETSMEMPKNKQAIVEFVKKYNRYDFSQTLPPEKFLTWGHENFYQGDIANWDSRRKFRP